MRSVAKYVSRYLFNEERACLSQVVQEHANLALRYFFDLSSTANGFNCNLMTDHTFLQAYRDYRHFTNLKSSGVLEIERFTALYRELEGVFYDISALPIINQDAAEPGLNIGQMNYAQGNLRVIAKLISENYVQFETVSVEADYFPTTKITVGDVSVPRNMKGEVHSLSALVTRFLQGLQVLKVQVYPEQVLKKLSKEMKK